MDQWYCRWGGRNGKLLSLWGTPLHTKTALSILNTSKDQLEKLYISATSVTTYSFAALRFVCQNPASGSYRWAQLVKKSSTVACTKLVPLVSNICSTR